MNKISARYLSRNNDPTSPIRDGQIANLSQQWLHEKVCNMPDHTTQQLV
jgi:hypothetical protein